MPSDPSPLLRRLLKKPWFRAQICATSMGAILLAGTAAYGAHRAKDSALRLGSEILTSAAPTSSADSISFNGAHFYFSVRVLNAKLSDVLSGAEAICKREGADLERDLGPALAKVPLGELGAAALTDELDVSRLLTVRTEADATGEVGCWVRRGQGEPRSIWQRARAFGESLDFSEFGSLQFVHAEQHGNRTLVRVLWSEGKLSMRDFFPENRDTPGTDLSDLPRPPGSFRVISAHVQGANRHVVGYQSAQTPEQLNAFYGEHLSKLGWSEIDLGGHEEQTGTLLQHAYEREGRHALLALTPSASEDEPGTGATFVEFPKQP